MTISKPVASQLLAQWIAEEFPQLFDALATRANADPASLAGITDVLRSIGSGISTAARSVATGLTTAVKQVGGLLNSPQGMSTLSSLASVYLQTKQAKDSLALQVQQAQAGQPPQPITTVTTGEGTYMAYTPQPGVQMSVTSDLLRTLSPSFFQRNWPRVLGGGFVATILLAALASGSYRK